MMMEVKWANRLVALHGKTLWLHVYGSRCVFHLGSSLGGDISVLWHRYCRVM